MSESDSARDEAIKAAREKATDRYEAVELTRDRVLRGPLQRALTSPLRHLQDATEELLRPEPPDAIILGLPHLVRVPVGDRAEIERLLEVAYVQAGWTGVDELIHHATLLSRSHIHGRQSDAGAAAIILDDLKLAASLLGRRIARVLVAADASVRKEALEVLAKSRDAADPARVGLRRRHGTWGFDHSSNAKSAAEATRKLAQDVIAAWRQVVKLELRLAAESPEVQALRHRVNPMLDRPLLAELELMIEIWQRSPEVKAQIASFNGVLDGAARQRWLLDRWWRSLFVIPAAEDALASSLGDTTEQVLDANHKVVAAIKGQGSSPAWALAARPDVALAETIHSEISAWRYRLLVTAVTGQMGFLPGTFEWAVIQQVYAGVDLVAREDAEFDAALGTTSATAGMLSMIPPLRPILSPLCAGLAVWRVYRHWSRYFVDAPGWWAVLDPDFSSRAPAPELTALLLDSGMAMLDVVQVEQVATFLRACGRWLPLVALALKLAHTPGPALRYAEAGAQAARMEMTVAAGAAEATYAAHLRAVAAARAAAAVPVRPVAPPATATATPDPVTLQPAPGFRSNLAEEMARRMAPLARAAAQRGDSAPAAPKQTAAPPPSASIQKRPKRRKRKPTRRGKRRPQTPGKRGRLGVPDEGYLLGPPVHGEDLYGRPFRTITIRVGRKVTRVERQRPDLLSLLPQEVKDEFPKLIRRAKHELWVKFKKEFNFTRPEELFQWLHASGPGWGVDVAPELFGPYLFNLSAQGHVENAVRRLAEIYGREGQGLFVTVTEYAHAPSVVSNGKWFVSEVVYTLSKGGVPNSQNTIVRTAIKAATPAEYAANGEVLKKTIDEVPNPAIDPGLLYQDVVNVAPEQFSPVKRGMIPDSE